jgi:hypothetical protein
MVFAIPGLTVGNLWYRSRGKSASAGGREDINYIQPSDEEMAGSRLLYIRFVVPESFLEDTPDWTRFVETQNFAEWYQRAVAEALTAVGADPGSVAVLYVRRPPLAEGLTPEFFVNLDPISQTLIVNATWDSLKLFLMTLNTIIRYHLINEGFPEDAYRLWYSPTTLEDFCREYVRRSHHKTAKLWTEHSAFNTYYDGNYAYPIDESKPMGWEITVSTKKHSYVFVADSCGTVYSCEWCHGKHRQQLPIPDLFEIDDA